MKQGRKPERYWLTNWHLRLRGQITDEAIRQLKQEPDAVSIIYELIEEQGVQVAREIYHKVFEPLNKVEIEQSVERLFVEAIFGEYPRNKVEVPKRFVLGHSAAHRKRAEACGGGKPTSKTNKTTT